MKEESLLQHREAEVLYLSDLMKYLGIGASAARLAMDELPSIKIGQRDAVFRTDLERYLRENGGVKIRWPRRRR